MTRLTALFVALCVASAFAFDFTFVPENTNETQFQPTGFTTGATATNFINLTLSWPANSTGFTFYFDIVTRFNGTIESYVWRNDVIANESPDAQILNKFITFSPCSNVSNTATTYFAAAVVLHNITRFTAASASVVLSQPAPTAITLNTTTSYQVTAPGADNYLVVVLPDAAQTNTTHFRAHVVLKAAVNATLPISSVCTRNETCPGTCDGSATVDVKSNLATLEFTNWQRGTKQWIRLGAASAYENANYDVLIYLTPQGDSDESGWSKTKIAAVAGGAIIAVAVVGLIIYFVARKSRTGYEQV